MKENFLVVMYVLLVVFPVGLVVWNYVTEKDVLIGQGTVLAKSYNSRQSSSGVGVSPQGGSPIVVSTSSRERWTLIVKIDNETFSIDTNSNTWGNLEESDKVRVYDRRGFLGSSGKIVRAME